MISAYISLVFFIDLLVSDDFPIEHNQLTARDSDGLYGKSLPWASDNYGDCRRYSITWRIGFDLSLIHI